MSEWLSSYIRDTADAIPGIVERYVAIQRHIFNPRVIWLLPVLIVGWELLSFLESQQRLTRLNAAAAYARAESDRMLLQSPHDQHATKQAVHRSSAAALEALNAHQKGHESIFLQGQFYVVLILGLLLEAAAVLVIASRQWWLLVTAVAAVVYGNVDDWFPPPLQRPVYETCLTRLGPTGPKPDEATDLLNETADAIAFPEVKSLSPESALVLARWRGDLLLDDLAILSPETAANLSTHEGVLSLNGLNTLSEEAAIALAKHRGPIHLTALLECPPHAMEMLKSKPTTKKHGGDWRGWIRFLFGAVAVLGPCGAFIRRAVIRRSGNTSRS